MPTYFGLWHFRPELLPPDPTMQAQMYEAFVGLYHSQVESGLIKEVHSFLDGISGYYVSGDISHEKMLLAVQQWLPFVTSEVHQTVKFPTPIENNIAIAKARAAMMK
ncbi:MAG: hypothetical protein L3J87_02730 [Thermoplasmata archaeon]|nr:hypothetical protein [Thermoplasmata archaeon]